MSPGNKDRVDERAAFVAKAVNYLHLGASVIIIDVVTTRHANLHNEIMKHLKMPASFEIDATPTLYAAAYRPVIREQRTEIDVWKSAFSVGSELPTMPMRLAGNLFIPVEFEPAYMEARRRRKML